MNIVDNIIHYFSPTTGLKRQAARLAAENLQRKHDIARRGRSNNWGFGTNSAREQEQDYLKAAEAAKQLCNNNGHASNAKSNYAISVVGTGGVNVEILPIVEGGRNSQNRIKRAQNSFNEWSESLDCDFDGDYMFGGLQYLIISAMFETGGVFVRKHINTDLDHPLQLQVLDLTMLDRTKNDGSKIHNGVQYNDNGQVQGYWLYVDKSGLNISGDEKSIYLERNKDVIFMRRKERPGTHLAMTWLAQSGSILEKYDTLMDAKITQEQVAACLALIVENAQQAFGTSSQGTPVLPDKLEPGIIEYVENGTKVHTVTPPSSTSNGNLTREIKQDMAVGVKMPYATFTGDFSQFNFTSGRLSQLVYESNVAFIQKQVLVPILNIIFKWWIAVEGLKNNQLLKEYKLSWIMPPRVVVDPEKEFDQLCKEVRAGFKAPSTAVTQWTGKQLEDVMIQWNIDKALWKDLPFDIDPSKFSVAGNQLNADDAASDNSQFKESNKDVKNSDNEKDESK